MVPSITKYIILVTLFVMSYYSCIPWPLFELNVWLGQNVFSYYCWWYSLWSCKCQVVTWFKYAACFQDYPIEKKTVRMSKDVFKNAVIEIILYIVLNLILFTIIIILFVTVYLIFTNSDVNNKIIYYIYYIKSRQQYIINFYNLSTNWNCSICSGKRTDCMHINSE